MVPHAVLTAMRSHVIQDYQKYCMEIGREESDILSSRTLWNILNAIKPSLRHCLSGLDNTTADGLTAFACLIELISKTDISTDKKKELTQALEQGKRYLKISYKTHCSSASNCATHCSTFALSKRDEDNFRTVCIHSHDQQCQECINLLLTLDQILMLHIHVTNSEVEEFKYDCELNIKMVLEFMRHILRADKQDDAKIYAMKLLSNTTAFWLKDWAQKILPQSFREKQSDYFGKKGMSLHIDTFYSKKDDSLIKQVYYTAIFRCDQDMSATLSVADHVIKQFHKDYANVKSLVTKSDNAGCYAGASCFQSEYQIVKKHDLTLLRHDFSEPQHGKDQCDRESAVARKLMAAYVNSGNDLKSAQDIRKALLYRGERKNYKVYVIEIDREKCFLPSIKIADVQSIHSVKFEENCMTLWMFFDIGNGKIEDYTNEMFVSGVHVISGFNDSIIPNPILAVGAQETANRLDRQYSPLLFCADDGCSSSFSTQEELEEHVLQGKHKYVEKSSAMDDVKSSFCKRIRTSEMEHKKASGGPSYVVDENIHSSNHLKLCYTMGWALKPKRKGIRFSVKQKKFVLDLYLEGENSGRKYTGDQVVQLMRKKSVNGKKTFVTSEYFTKEQVISLFSVFTTKKKQGKLQQLLDHMNNVTDEDVDFENPDGETIEEEEVYVV
jgi:hypothetical protein